MLTLANSTLNALKHHSCQGQLAQCECVPQVDVDAEGGQAHETRVHVSQKVVNFGSEEHFVFELNLFFVDFVNLLDEIGLPTKELDSLDVVESLVDVKAALLFLAPLLLTDVFLSLAAHVLHQHVRPREE